VRAARKPQMASSPLRVTVFVEPSFICINGAWLDTEEPALQACGELIAELITVKGGASLEQQAGSVTACSSN